MSRPRDHPVSPRPRASRSKRPRMWCVTGQATERHYAKHGVAHGKARKGQVKAARHGDAGYDDKNMAVFNKMMKMGATRKAERFMEELYSSRG